MTSRMSSAFTRGLRQHQVTETGRRWLFVPYDQLSDAMGPLSREPARELGIVLVEAPWKAARRPYHKQKLALVLANLRHFALEQAARGVAVRHVVAKGSYGEALRPLTKELGSLRVMEPAERELRVDLAPLVMDGLLEVLPHEGWLSTPDDFRKSHKNKAAPWRMDQFYRFMRSKTGILMQDGEPRGGQWSFDMENRKPWRGEPKAPTLPTFTPDAITREVGELVATKFAHHPGTLDLSTLPATREDAETLWRWAQGESLPHFGPFEDAMATHARTLFHTRVSGLLNLHRLLPMRLVRDTEAMKLPLASQEGFIRQILGWREFMHHVHVATDGFRTLHPNAAPSFLDAHDPLPKAYWGTPSGLNCLDTVVKSVWDEGYSHHITRLMVLSNLATLLGISPREVTDWFWEAYIDAYDWVVEPNVLMMGTYGTGPLATTKPYISGAAYIDRMSDYCQGCAFDPKKNCPVTSLYWDFLARSEKKLGNNVRLKMPYVALHKRSDNQRAADARIAALTRKTLQMGDEVSPLLLADVEGSGEP